MQERKHIQYLDVLKGIVIFLVVVGHAYHFGFAYYRSPLLLVLRSIDMPIFCFLSGYLAYRGWRSIEQGGAWLQLRRKCIQLLVPLILLPSLYNLCYDVGWQEMLLGVHHGGYWFTFVLFQLFVLYMLFRMLTARFNAEDDGQVELSLALLLVFAVLILNMYWEQWHLPSHQALSWGKLHYLLPYFLLGHMVSKHERLDALMRQGWMIALSGVAFFFLIYEEYTVGRVLSGEPASLMGLTFMYGAVSKLGQEQTQMNRLWAYLGRESRSIYLLHYFFLFSVPWLKPLLEGELVGKRILMYELAPALAYAALVVCMSLVVVRLLRTSPVLELLCFGKEIKPKRRSVMPEPAPSLSNPSVDPNDDLR